VKLSFKEQKELDSLPATIESLEAEQTTVASRLADPETYQGESALVKQLTDRATEIETLILAAMTRWEALDAKQRGGK
jgi:ABC transport system ATP-binding/permease protein